MRKAILAAGVAMLVMAGAPYALAQQTEPAAAQPAAAGIATAAVLRATTPSDAAADRTYESAEQALRAADLDYMVQEGRRRLADGERDPVWRIVVFADEVASGRHAEARALLADAPGGLTGPIGDMFEPFLFAAEGLADRGVERVDSGADNLPAPLPEAARALVFESAGRLHEAAAVYAEMVGRLDLRPPPQREPTNLEEFERSLGAARTAHALYRAALTQHRLGNGAEARRLYGLVQEFAPRSIDVQRNLERLEAGEAPSEAALDPSRALGRWMLFLAEYVTQAEMLSRVLASEDPALGLGSTTGSALLQLGVALARDADDWRLHAASQLLNVRSPDGAERILNLMPADSVFAPDADISRAGILLERRRDDEAVAAADRALAAAGDRWPLIASAGDIYRQANRSREAIAAFDRALALTEKPEDRADVLGWRAYAHRFAGNTRAATADARRALEADPSVDTRLIFVSVLMFDRSAWADAIREARALFAEQPDSVMRLNALGYALIQRPEGLEEGYRLLWRGYAFGQTDYAVIDSLGWAYYLYGRFDDALMLIQRANELSANSPNAEILDHLGDVYWRLDRRDEARAAWREALQARPEAPRRASLERKISRGVTEAAPRQRELPRVTLPQGPGQRETL